MLKSRVTHEKGCPPASRRNLRACPDMHALRGNAHLGKLHSVSAAERVEEIEKRKKNITELIASHEHFIFGGELCFHVSNRTLQRIASTPYFIIFCDTLLGNTVPRTLSAY